MRWFTRVINRVFEALSPRDEKSEPKPNHLKVPQWVAQQCEHRPERGPFEVPVNGWRVYIHASLACPDCVGEWLQEVVEECQTCGAPILPGDQIVNESSGYVHYPFCCNEGESAGQQFELSPGTPPDLH